MTASPCALEWAVVQLNANGVCGGSTAGTTTTTTSLSFTRLVTGSTGLINVSSVIVDALLLTPIVQFAVVTRAVDGAGNTGNYRQQSCSEHWCRQHRCNKQAKKVQHTGNTVAAHRQHRCNTQATQAQSTQVQATQS